MVLNATSVVVRRRNRSFLCMCGRNCIFDIIIIIIIINIVILTVKASAHTPGLSRNNPHDINHGR